ncbi:MAG: hypothetical protein KQJ78_06660 [Deltaproteobacteria bacterium]|nr:hypothetical protein [Deltaproteobacteria bacterium]
MNRFLGLAAAICLVLVGAGEGRADLTCAPIALPRPGQWEAGVQGAWIFSQDFRNINATVSRGGASYSVPVRDLQIDDDQSWLVRVAYGVNDHLSIFAKLGVTDGGQFKFRNWDGDSGSWWSNEFKLKSVFTWAGGAQVRVFETAAGLGALLAAQYQRYDDRKTGDMDSHGHGTSYNDFQAAYWQADVAASLYQKLGL